MFVFIQLRAEIQNCQVIHISNQNLIYLITKCHCFSYGPAFSVQQEFESGWEGLTNSFL